MKKLLSLIGVLLLWQSVAVAQNYLHITSGNSTKVVRMVELDSVTVRDAEFYKPDFGNVDGLRFVGTVADYWDRPFAFDVTLAQGEGATVYIQNLDPFFLQNGFIADQGVNILVGELVPAVDGKSATIICQLGQSIGYEDCMFYNPFGGESIQFVLVEDALTCTTGYGVCTSNSEWYTAFSSFTLNLAGSTQTAAPSRMVSVPSEPLQLKRLELPSAIAPASPRHTTQEGKVNTMQLKPITTREITE